MLYKIETVKFKIKKEKHIDVPTNWTKASFNLGGYLPIVAVSCGVSIDSPVVIE